MSEQLGEPVGGGDPLLGEPAAADVETSADEHAETPGAIYICPACGARYDEPTTCTNGHAAAETVEYDRATVEKADAGDADALASVNETAATAAGNMAGAVVSEATPPVVAVDPAAAAPVANPAAAAAPAAAPAPATHTTAVPDGIAAGDVAAASTAHGTAFANVENALAELKHALGLG